MPTEEYQQIYLDSSKISSLNLLYDENNLKQIKADNYKLIIFKKQAFDSVAEIQVENQVYSKDFAFALLNSDTPVEDYIDDLLIREGVPQELREASKANILSDFEYSDTEFKGVVFATMMMERIDTEGPIFIFKQYKSGNAVVYKETAVFKMINIIPTSFLQNMIQTTKETIKDKI
jgi:hypothetical protein